MANNVTSDANPHVLDALDEIEDHIKSKLKSLFQDGQSPQICQELQELITDLFNRLNASNSDLSCNNNHLSEISSRGKEIEKSRDTDTFTRQCRMLKDYIKNNVLRGK